ncbi:conserved hypothetical protein, precursor [Deinococcus proteolyticus MRP]|uniref:Uncharacterized protein n=1 Tax=Deinococcus proteolyticus (strain ATCC 35074 / DSM 20540 / JCM 6276 / NBRC 101906 / NCIMB 13154 / VKM Ac-1939 / CCM 2703 / MRP) TaxID=693977 RepID=F0RMG2_DEIPM|nr:MULTISPECIES: hypothetical protein [Deinococcus]ADY26012.1 conserved hypothetical protein, precursor [Deinococcus proteolyticus MRP]MCY1702133.1 hypothetical protein [Deinococcus sp. SL84]
MKKTLSAVALATLSVLPAAHAQGNSWGGVNPATATYVILSPQVNGNRSLVSAGDYQTVVKALANDSAGAIKRRYPGATIATDPNTAGAIQVTPILTAPSALLPWAKFSAALSLKLPSGRTVNVRQNFGVLEVYNHRADAANYIFDQLAKQLP